MRKSAHIPAVLVTLLALITIPNPVSADFTWQEQILASGIAGSRLDAVYDSSGVLHFTATSGFGHLLHGELSGGSAQVETIYTTSSIGPLLDIQVAPSGDLGILFSDDTADQIILIERSSGTWSAATVDSTRALTLALAYDSGNNAHAIHERNNIGYYCSPGGGGWSCTKFHADSITVWNARGLAITPGDTLHAAVNIAGPDDFQDDNSVLLDLILPLPALLETIAVFSPGFSEPVETRLSSDGSLHVLASNLDIDGVDCQRAEAMMYSRSGLWTGAGIHEPGGGYPIGRAPQGFDIDENDEVHAIYVSTLGSPFCSACDLECWFGFPSGDPACAAICSTTGIIRYSRMVDSVLVEEFIPGADSTNGALLDLDPGGVPRVLGRRGTDIVLFTRDVSTGVLGSDGDAQADGVTDGFPSNGLRVLVSPNPSARVFSFAVSPGASLEVIDIYDIRGRRVRTLSSDDGATTGSASALTWDGADASGRPVAKGVYFARFEFGTRTETHKLTVVR